MITTAQQSYIEEHAYLPEHIISYVVAVSHTEPFLLDDFLIYVKKEQLIFVGYPLQKIFEANLMKEVLNQAIYRFKPKEIALTAPAIPSSITGSTHLSSDHYYKLDLLTLSVSQKTRNMINRAMKEIVVRRVKPFSRDHQQLVEEFLGSHPVDEATRWIFKRIPDYVSSVPTAWILEARSSREELLAFDVAEFGSKYYAMYMFNFRSKGCYAPGASDLLLSEFINFAKAEQKEYINLGLGINPGVTYFKRKWGGAPFLPYTYCLYSPRREERLEALLQKL